MQTVFTSSDRKLKSSHAIDLVDPPDPRVFSLCMDMSESHVSVSWLCLSLKGFAIFSSEFCSRSCCIPAIVLESVWFYLVYEVHEMFI